MHRDAGRILIGLVIIVIGGAYLARALGWIDIDPGALLQLWPVLIIAGGIALLPRTGLLSWVIGFFAITLTIAAVGTMFYTGAFEQRVVEVTEFAQEKHKDSEQGSVRIQTGAGKLTVRGHESEHLASGIVRSDVSRVHIEDELGNGTQHIVLRSETDRTLWIGSRMSHTMDVLLANDIPLTVDIQSGAMDMDIDFRNVLLERSTFSIGASNLNIMFGDMSSADVTIKAGASSITVTVPETVGVRASIDSGITSHTFTGLQKIEDNVYESPNIEDAEHVITLTFKVGASSATITRQ
jgi:hypothetical protein